MTRLNPPLEAFNSGELSPRLAARLTFDRYPFGCALLENLLPLIEGGAMRAPGSRYVAAAKDETALPRMIGFVFSTVQAYMLEFGPSSVRFFRHQAPITVAATNAAITNGTFASNITGWDDRSTGGASISHDSTNEMLQLVGASGQTAWAEQDVAVSSANKDTEHVLKFRVVGVAGDTIQLRVGTTSTGNEVVDDVEFGVGYHCHAFTPTATTFYVQFRNTRAKTVKIDDVSLIDDAPVEIDSPYAAADLRKIRYAQSADVLFLVADGYAFRKLSRRGHPSWSLTEIDNLDGPYLDTNTTATTLDPSATTGLGITITASAAAGINGGAGFLTTDVGRLVRIEYDSAWGYARITARASTTSITVDVKRDFTGGHAPKVTWRLGAWSDTTGHPKAIGFFEQRAILAATTDQPKTFWGSQSLADYENFQPDDGSGTVEDDDAFGFTLGSGGVDAIEWVVGARRLMIGTSSGEWLITSDGPILKPSDIEVVIHTTHGSSDVAPIHVGHVVLYLQKAKRRIRELVFDFDVDGLRAPDMTALSTHILKGGVLEMAYQQEPGSVVWCVRNDGQLAAMTYERSDPQKNVVGWSRRILGGSFESGHAIVESVATIPGANGTGQTKDSTDRNEVWISVKRTINGSTRRYIEFFEGDFEGPRREDYDSRAAWQRAMIEAQKDAYYADSLLTYSGALTTTITGATHLVGEEVAILANGAVHPKKTVNGSGEVTLDWQASPVHLGLPLKHKYKSLRPVQTGKMGSPVGQTQRILGVGYVLLDAGVLRIGPDADNLELEPFRHAAYAMDTAVPLFTGEGYAQFDGDYELDPRIVIEDDAPEPFTLLALAPRVELNEK
jgi:hypothetical protein